MCYTIGIDIGGTNFRIGSVSQNGEVEHFEKISSRIFDNGNVIDILAESITDYIERHQIAGKVLGVAIGLPSLVSKDKSTVISTPNLKGFDNLLLVKELSKVLSMPVFLDRDVNFLLQNDIERLKLPKDSTVLGFYIGTGLGNAMYLDGKLYSGSNGAAGELGHIPLWNVTETCTCGNVGCSELRCSGRYLETLTKTYFPETKIRNVFKEHGDDPRVIQYIKGLAIPISAEINILDPQYIIIAGGVSEMPEFPKELLKKEILFHSRKPYPEQNLQILFTEHNQQSGVYGSGSFALSQLKQQVDC